MCPACIRVRDAAWLWPVFAPTLCNNPSVPLCCCFATPCARVQDPVPGAVRPTVGASPDEARNAWEPERDYVMVGDRPLNQVRRVQGLAGGFSRCSRLRCGCL